MMKKLILSVVLSAACMSAISAALPQSDAKGIGVSDTRVVRTDNLTVSVSFRVDLGYRITTPNRSLVIIPSLLGTGGQESKLPPIVVRGARATADAENRAMNAVGVDASGRHLTSSGKSLEYRASIPWQEWMEGSQLVMSGLNTGRGKSTEVELGVVADRVLAGERSRPAPVPTPDYTAVLPATPSSYRTQWAEPVYETSGRQHMIATIGDELAARFTFVEPSSKFKQTGTNSAIDEAFDYNMPLIFGTGAIRQENEGDHFIEMTRQGALYVGFERGNNVIDRDLGENNSKLVDLISAIRVLETSPDTRIVHVVVAGFSAPEGAIDEKETLAPERAEVVRDFLTANSRIDPAIIGTYNGSVDWTGLRILVAESNMPEKYRILEIIDNVPAWGNPRNRGRMAQLIALNDGEDFSYMRELFFPQIRQTGVYVKIYYENVR